MNTEKNKTIIRSLVGRLVPKGTVYELPGGILSKDEVNALRRFGEASGLVLKAFDTEGPPEETIRLCLDFGTAMSKAWASRREDGDTIPLVLGQFDASDDKHATGDKLVVPSAVYISQSGGIYFGEAAEKQHRAEMETGRKRFDNLKQMLSDEEIGPELDDLLLSPDIDPTGSVSKGDLLVLYLAWLTDLALKALANAPKDEVDGVPAPGSLRYVRRRFAIPCFEQAQDESRHGDKRATWAKSVMERYLLRAQIVADTLTGSWSDLTVEKARPLLVECRDIDTGSLSHLLAENAPVREPVAAGASRFNETIERDDTGELVRKTLLVVDAGAGTTDFALFQTFRKRDGEIRYGLIPSSVRMCRVAGNRIDGIIYPLALQACNIDLETRRQEEASRIKRSLDSQLRDIKHELFDKQEVNIELQPNGSGILRLDGILRDQEYQTSGRELLDAREEIIRSVFSDKLDDLREGLGGSQYPIHVLLTGGSASLPIIRDLATSDIGIDGVSFRFSEVVELPRWINRFSGGEADRITDHYPQCAVAIGGSVRELPQEIPVRDIIVPPPPGKRQLESY